MFNNFRSTLGLVVDGTLLRFLLAFGELNGRRWVLPQCVESADVTLSEMFRLGSVKLQNHCIPLNGLQPDHGTFTCSGS